MDEFPPMTLSRNNLLANQSYYISGLREWILSQS